MRMRWHPQGGFTLTTLLLFLLYESFAFLFMSLALLTKEQQPFTSTLRACMKLHSTSLHSQFSSFKKKLRPMVSEFRILFFFSNRVPNSKICVQHLDKCFIVQFTPTNTENYY